MARLKKKKENKKQQQLLALAPEFIIGKEFPLFGKLF